MQTLSPERNLEIARRVREAVRFVRVSGEGARRKSFTQEC